MSDSIIMRTTAKNMVTKYQNAPAGGINPNTNQNQELTQFVHFTFAQFFELLTMNGIVTGSDTINNILQNKSSFGIKIYFAQHADISDCPDNDSTYIGRNTLTIVNTVKKNNVWYDMPDTDNTNSVIQEFVSASSGRSLDKGTQCPPQCTGFANSL